MIKHLVLFFLFIISEDVLSNPWQNLTNEWITIDSLGNMQIYRKISCFDSNNCIALAGQFPAGDNNYVKLTEDGGKTWMYILEDTMRTGSKEQNYKDKYNPSRFYEIQYVSKNSIYISSDSGRIFVSNNKGINWEKKQFPTNLPFTNIRFINEKVGIVGSSILFLTNDSGKSWSKIDPDLMKFSNKLLYIDNFWQTDEQNIYISCPYDTIIRSDDPFGIYRYMHSSDAGNNWELLHDTTHEGSIIQFIDNEIGYALGAEKDVNSWNVYIVIYKTIDGGNSWKRIYTDDELSNPFYSIKFLDKDNGIVTSEYSIFSTSDGGNSWKKLYSKDINHIGIVFHSDIEWRTKYHPILASGFYLFEYQTPTDIDEVNNIDNVFLAPNPASDFIEINMTNRGIKSSVENIRIFNMLGLEVIQSMDSHFRGNDSHFQGGEIVRLNISDLPPGVYFVRVGDVVRKFLKL